MSKNLESDHCEQHPDRPAAGRCSECGKAICRECIREFGYFCSETCLAKSRNSVTEEDRAAAREADRQVAKAARLAKIILAGVVVAVLSAAGAIAWRFWLDPSGKICWQWQCDEDLGKMGVIFADGERVVVRSGGRLVTLDSKTGEAITDGGGEIPGEGLLRIVPLKTDRMLIIESGKISCFECEGTEVYSLALPGDCTELVLDREHSSALLAVTPAWQPPAQGTEVDQRLKLINISLITGKEVWQKRLNKNTSVSGLGYSEDRDSFHAVLRQYKNFLQQSCFFCFFNSSDGKGNALEMPEGLEWGPEYCEGMVVVQKGGELIAFNAEGDGTEQWSRPVDCAFPAHFAAEDLFFIQTAGGTQPVDVTNGNTLWEMDILVGKEGLTLTETRILAKGSPVGGGKETSGKAGGPLPPALGENEDLIKDIGFKAPNVRPARPVLLCLDRKTGEELWRIPKVLGELLTDGKRLLQVMDTSKTSMLQMAAGGKGVTVIRQYDMKDGSQFYSRTSEIGFVQPVLAQTRLVGLTYRRVDRPGALSGVSAMEPEPLQCIGVTAFKLR